MLQRKRLMSFLWQGLAAVVLIASGAAYADLMVTATVTPVGELFHYEYEITNDSPFDYLLIDIAVLPMDASLTNLFVPAGFLGIYDSGLGLVTFLGDVELFAVGTTWSGFGFDSAYSSGTSTFDALTLLGDFDSGTTQAPVGPPLAPVVPEPASATLLVTGLGALMAIRGRRRNRVTD